MFLDLNHMEPNSMNRELDFRIVSHIG